MTWLALATRWATVGLPALLAAATVMAQAGNAAEKSAAGRGKPWAALTVQEQQALQPLKNDWASLEPNRQRKWLEVAARFPTMSGDERARIQERMAQWASLTPAQRTQARLQFQETRQISPGERQARWEEYQALTDDQRRALAERAVPAGGRPAGADPSGTAQRGASAASAAAPKNNLVTLQPPAVRPVTPTIVQAKPGATTLPMSSRPAPPPHHQAGVPKIAATPEFVDPATLLPRRPPQAPAKVGSNTSGEPDKAP